MTPPERFATPDAAWEAVADAVEQSAKAEGDAPENAAPEDARVAVLVDKYEHVVVANVRRAMANHPDLFKKNGTLVRVVQPDQCGPDPTPPAGSSVPSAASAPRIQTADPFFVRERISGRCHLQTVAITKEGAKKFTHVSPPRGSSACSAVTPAPCVSCTACPRPDSRRRGGPHQRQGLQRRDRPLPLRASAGPGSARAADPRRRGRGC